MDHYFAGGYISTGFLHEIVLIFESEELTEYVLRNHYRAG